MTHEGATSITRFNLRMRRMQRLLRSREWNVQISPKADLVYAISTRKIACECLETGKAPMSAPGATQPETL
jgi:hypothetical protein